LDSESGTDAESGKLARCCGDAPACFGMLCCASVLWMLANLRCSRSTCARAPVCTRLPEVWYASPEELRQGKQGARPAHALASARFVEQLMQGPAAAFAACALRAG